MRLNAFIKTLALGLIICPFIGLPILGLAGLYSLKFGDCVRLPNGIELGYEAYLDFSRPYLIPDAVLREPNGNVIANDIWPIHVTEKAAFGKALFENNDYRSDYRFIWTAETGVVNEHENPELYQRLSNDLGEVYYGAPKEMNTNTLWIFKRLSEDERFHSSDCNTSLVTW